MKRRQFLVAASAAAPNPGPAQTIASASPSLAWVRAAPPISARFCPWPTSRSPRWSIPTAGAPKPLRPLIFQKTGKRPKIDSDMRRIFEDKEIDAVTIATTNHWHTLTAIWAMQAGKDVYVEKPVSHNIWEGTKLVETARKYKRIAAGGTQRRWWGRFRKAIELIHGGAIGDVYQGTFVFPGRRDSIGFKETEGTARPG